MQIFKKKSLRSASILGQNPHVTHLTRFPVVLLKSFKILGYLYDRVSWSAVIWLNIFSKIKRQRRSEREN